MVLKVLGELLEFLAWHISWRVCPKSLHKEGEIAPSWRKLQGLLRGPGARNYWVREAGEAGKSSHHGAQGLWLEDSLRNCWKDQEGPMSWGWETAKKALQEQEDKPVSATTPWVGWGPPWKQGKDQGWKQWLNLFYFCSFFVIYQLSSSKSPLS